MRSHLFDTANAEVQTGERWVKQNSKMVRTALGPDVLAVKGVMVAYQGQITFHHEGSGSVGKFIRRALTSEDTPLMRVSGRQQRVSRGTVAVVRNDGWHELINDTSENVEILVIQVRV